MQIDTAISQFQDYLIVQRGYSVGTAKGYGLDLSIFSDYLVKRDFPNLVQDIEQEHIVSFLGYLSHPDDEKVPNIVTTRARKLASIRSFFTFLRKRKVIVVSPAEDIDMPTLPQKEPDYLTISEYERLLDAIAETASPFFKIRDLAIVSLFITTGIRVSELVNLKLSDLDLEYLTIKVHRKGSKEQTIPITEEVAELIQAYLAIRPDTESEKLFISKKRNGIRSNSVYCLVSKYLGVAGIRKNKNGPHLLRHTCFTTLLTKNVNPVVIQQLANHVSFNTTRRYLHLNNTQIREAITKISLKKGEI